MKAEEYRNEITKYEATIQVQQETFSTYRKKLVEVIKPFVKEQLKNLVESEVRSNPEHTKSLGLSTLSEMKSQLKELLENSDNIVESIYADNKLWTYMDYKIDLKAGPYEHVFENKNTAASNVRHGIQVALGEAGKILEAYKYVTIGGSSKDYRWENSMRYDYTQANRGKSRVMYGSLPQLPKEITDLIVAYRNEIETHHESLFKLAELRDNLSEQEAMDLWDEA